MAKEKQQTQTQAQPKPQPQAPSLRSTINQITEQLVTELHGEELTPSEKISFLKILLPYSVGKLPSAVINYDMFSGQPLSGRIIEPTEGGGLTEEDRRRRGGFDWDI